MICVLIISIGFGVGERGGRYSQIRRVIFYPEFSKINGQPPKLRHDRDHPNQPINFNNSCCDSGKGKIFNIGLVYSQQIIITFTAERC